MTQVPPDHSARSCDVTELAGIVQPPGGWSLCMRSPKEEAGGGGATRSYRDREEGPGPAELLLLWGQGRALPWASMASCQMPWSCAVLPNLGLLIMTRPAPNQGGFTALPPLLLVVQLPSCVRLFCDAMD